VTGATGVIELSLVGIGTGNPEHLTRQGAATLNAADLILIPRKSGNKADLAELRHALCAAVVTNPATRVVDFDMPRRDGPNIDDVADGANVNYLAGVHRWHDAIAAVWQAHIAAHLPAGGRLALLVWGDPSLYDSTLRIADRLAQSLPLPLRVTVVPGITALQALTAAHAIPLNELNAPVTITTGRQLRTHGWPAGVSSVAVLLDGDCAFTQLDPAGLSIWWGAYLGMPEQLCLSGPLAQVGEQILQQRQAARAAHGWIMDTYLLRRG